MTTRIRQIIPCTTDAHVRSRLETDDGAPMEGRSRMVHLWALIEDTETKRQRIVPVVHGDSQSELEIADEEMELLEEEEE